MLPATGPARINHRLMIKDNNISSHRAHRVHRGQAGQPPRTFPWLRQAHPSEPPQSSLREYKCGLILCGSNFSYFLMEGLAIDAKLHAALRGFPESVSPDSENNN